MFVLMAHNTMLYSRTCVHVCTCICMYERVQLCFQLILVEIVY